QDTPSLVRLADAVIGGVVAIVLNVLLAPDAHRVALTTAEQLLDRLAAAYRALARALEEGRLEVATRAIGDLETLETVGRDLETSLEATKERITFGQASTRHAQRRRLRAMLQLTARSGVMVVSARSTARAVSTLARHRSQPDPALVTGLEQLAQAVLELRRWVGGTVRMEVVREAALRAAVTASKALRTGPGTEPAAPAEQALAWQLRASAVDVLRVLGLSYGAAVAAVEEAAGRVDRPLEE